MAEESDFTKIAKASALAGKSSVIASAGLFNPTASVFPLLLSLLLLLSILAARSKAGQSSSGRPGC
jgi:hypothetical protein